MDGFFPPAHPRSELSLAVESLCRRYDAWFRRVLRHRYGDQADDLAHEAYLRAAAHEAEGRVQHPKAFLLNVANNLATDRRRRELRENDYATYLGAFPTQSTAATQEMAVTLKQILLALPSELRDCLIMSRVNGQTHGEIALQLGLTKRTVKDRVRRASILVAAAMQD
ncbi:pyoverdine signaling pathway sigma factor FpvI [soil metagenome]